MAGNNRRFCLALDLKDDPALIDAYQAHHRNVWPEVLKSIHEAGIVEMDIYRVENRLFMIMETEPGFSFEKKAQDDLSALDPHQASSSRHEQTPSGGDT